MEFRSSKQKKRRGDVVVRNGYYTFSKEYPAGQLERPSRAVRHRNRKRSVRRFLLLVLLFGVIVCGTFFAVDFGLKISKKAPDPAAIAVGQPTLLKDDGIRALVMPTETVRSKKELRAFIKKLRRRDCNTVVIDFKSSDGRLLYSSNEQLALRGKANTYNNVTVRDALKQFASANIHVLARVYCFEDPLIAALDESLAVKYSDTDVLWLDKHEQDGGKPWLNPYSTIARSYLKAVIREVHAFGVSGILLSSFSFPGGENANNASFPGENESRATRNTLLKKYITTLKGNLSEDCCLLVETEADALLNGDTARYDGRLTPNDADGIVVNTAVRPPETVPDKKTKFVSILAYLSSVQAKLDSEKMCVLLLEEEEVSTAYLRALRKNGFANQIRSDESGTY